MQDLVKARTRIDELDKKLVDIFKLRFSLLQEIAIYKKKENLPIYDELRELEILNRNVAYLNDESLSSYFKEFYKSLLHVSKEYQKDIIK